MGSSKGPGLGGIFGVGKSKAIEVKPEDVTVTYKDVGGADEAIAELQEIIQFLEGARAIRATRRAYPQGSIVGWPTGHRQDAAGQSHGRRGPGRILRDQRLRIR